ncbi:hypothetical protein CHELA41_24464 [Hyphomicrobiales bacterium]|nr:hypothetical protein CHELA41_24464 [Hyphomicrobiales bacterium]
MTPGFFNSRARSAQFGSGSRRAPCFTPARANSRFSSASSVSSPGSGQLSPEASARFRLSCTVLRAMPSLCAISRALVPSPASRSICRSCLMVSLLFAGITRPLFKRTVMPKLLTQVLLLRPSKWPDIDRNGGRLHVGTGAGFRLECPAGLRRNPHAGGRYRSP